MSNIIVFDTETTGLLKPEINSLKAQPEITEIHCTKLDPLLNIIDEFDMLIKPNLPIPEELERKIGITNQMVKDSPSFIDIYKQLSYFFMDCDTMVAHNIGFDRSMLANELSRIEKVLHFPWPINHICTVEKSMYIEQRRITLTKLHEHATGTPFEGAHRAAVDVAALVTCFKWLVSEGKI
jgi:DNA polymerase III epsilon subunit-like protein